MKDIKPYLEIGKSSLLLNPTKTFLAKLNTIAKFNYNESASALRFVKINHLLNNSDELKYIIIKGQDSKYAKDMKAWENFKFVFESLNIYLLFIDDKSITILHTVDFVYDFKSDKIIKNRFGYDYDN